MTRSKLTKKHSQQDKLIFNSEDLRWSTPEMVADYRAKRLACKTLVEIGSGIGFHTFAFAKTCEKVYAIEINKDKIEKAKQNAALLGIKNIEFIQGDALDDKIISKLKNVDIVFCDPERLPTEEERSIDTIKPNLAKLLEIYSQLTKNIAIELPPQIKTISFDAEQEYISIEGEVNRLTLYFGKLKQTERSAVVLPSGAKLVSNTKPQLKQTDEIQSYLYEPDSAVIKANLLAELSTVTETAAFSKEKNIFFTAARVVSSPFFKNAFKVLEPIEFNEKKIREFLKKNKIGKVVLRFSIDPKEYWSTRTKYEAGLKGDKKAHLFRFGKKAVVGELLG